MIVGRRDLGCDAKYARAQGATLVGMLRHAFVSVRRHRHHDRVATVMQKNLTPDDVTRDDTIEAIFFCATCG
jgi:hypothetical protein